MTINRPSFARRMGAIMNRAILAVSFRLHIGAANSWRDSYNPLRSLTISRAVSLLEEGERGAYADLQWTYRFIEMQDATLGALIERRTSAIQKLDWGIKIRDEVPEGKEVVAQTQEKALKAAYARIGNFSAALEFLALASFRGFSHLEKVRDGDGFVTALEPVEQWFWCREGIYGSWTLNKDSRPGVVKGEAVPLPRFIIREVARPINRVALVAFVRKGLSQKDWDAFIEAYGIPAVFIVMPPDVPPDRQEEYLQTADDVVSDARGALPHGSDVKTVDNGARGNNPFKDHLAYQDEQIVMRGTGGLLTMLTKSGSGTLAGNAHSDTFEGIAQAEAAEISEILRKQFDAEIIEEATPGEQAYAYFELAANEETDTAAVVRDVVSLSRAGYQVEDKWISEKTGYDLTPREVIPPRPIARLLNRLSGDPAFKEWVAEVRGADGAEWIPFPRETGTLGIPRSIMPQIRSENRAAMVNKLRSHGVDYVKQNLKPSDLKPTQAEYSTGKLDKARSYKGPKRAILVSSDNHVVDGHHQYLAALLDEPNVPIPVFKIKAPAMHAIGLLLRMPSTGQESTPIRNSIREDLEGLGDEDDQDLMQAARTALAKDADPIAAALFGAFEEKDEAAFQAALKKISASLPDLVSAPEFEEWLSSEMVRAWLGSPEPTTEETE